MNIYAETNFVLELVFEQEQFSSCEEILVLCEQGKAQLILPAYCLAEPHEKLTRQARNRKELQQNLNVELQQLSRTPSYDARIKSIKDIAGLLVQSNQEEEHRFIDYRQRLLRVSEFVPLTADILREAAKYEAPYDLTPPDAVVYASVLSHLQLNTPSTSCFLNRNTKDFDNPDIVAELAKYKCRMIPRFDHGRDFIKAQLKI
jgi:predicted nucleic acid-binding protein